MTRRLFVLRALCLALALPMASAAVQAAADPGVEAAQRRLHELGFDPGPEDGLMGPRTRGAIRAFQKANEIRVNGRLDAGTLRALFPAQPGVGKTGARGDLLTYAMLGWRGPLSGDEILSRFRRQTGSLDMKRSSRDLIVPDGDGIYVVASGGTVPGFDCRPAAGRVEMEFMLGPRGPVVFRPLDKKGYCQLGFGILLEVGQRLRISDAGGGGEIETGMVEVQSRGLRYVEGPE